MTDDRLALKALIEQGSDRVDAALRKEITAEVSCGSLSADPGTPNMVAVPH